MLVGSRDGAAAPRRAASHAAVRYSKTLRCCCCNVATTVSMLSTKREPSALCVPKLPLRQSTPGRIALSAVLFVGSTPATWTNVHNASRRFKMSRHVPSLWTHRSDCPRPIVAPLPDAVGLCKSETLSVAMCPLRERVERLINRLKQHRRLATRDEKCVAYCCDLVMVVVCKHALGKRKGRMFLHPSLP